MAWVEDKIRRMVTDVECIRNVSIIAHVDHGKTTLSDSLLRRAGLISEKKAGTARVLDTDEQEKERGITISSTSIALPLELPVDTTRADHGDRKSEAGEGDSEPMLVNLIDSPGHSDFSSEVTAALRLTDGAIIVVDVAEGVLAQTETVLRQAIQERVRPVLLINKVDRLIGELKLTPEEAVDRVLRVIESINSFIATYAPEHAAAMSVSFENGTVSIGSGYFGWAFSMDTLALLYDRSGAYTAAEVRGKFQQGTASVEKHTRRVRKWLVKLGFQPIYQLMGMVDTAYETEPVSLEKVWKKLASLGCRVPKVASEKATILQKTAMKAALSSFAPVASAVLYMVKHYLPNPRTAQKYRGPMLYTGPQGDSASTAIQACDPEGPLAVFISKMVPIPKSKGFIACGRVYSGTVRPGQKVLVLPPPARDVEASEGDEEEDSKTELSAVVDVPTLDNQRSYSAGVQRVVALLGGKIQDVGAVPCGNIVGLIGVDKHLLKSGTITSVNTTWPLRVMRFSVSPVVRVALQPPRPELAGKLSAAMKAYSKTDPCIVHYQDPETRELVLAGAGELHLEVAITSIAKLTGFGRPTVSEPVVSYRETVTVKGDNVLAKASNKLNRLFVEAMPLDEALVAAIESGDVDTSDADLGRRLVTKHGWENHDTKRIWAWGGGDTDVECTNVLVDCSTAVQNLPAIKASVINAFKRVCYGGAVAGERLRGVRFNLTDALVHRDSAHRGPGQIIPAATRAFQAAQLSAGPSLVEPMFRVDAQVPKEYYGSVEAELSGRRGQFTDVVTVEGTPLLVISGTVPVASSFGFSGNLRGLSSGRASTSMTFDSWKVVPGSVFGGEEESSGSGRGAGGGESKRKGSGSTLDLAASIALQIRERKSMKPGVPLAADLSDRL